MKTHWVLFVAQRFLRETRLSRRFAPSVLSILGISVGVIALVVVLGVMNGFQLGFINDILEISSYDLRITTSRPLPQHTLAQIARDKAIRAVVPFLDLQTLVKGAFTQFQPCSVRGLPVDAEALDPQLIRQLHIVQGSFDLSGGGKIVVGYEMANELSVTVGAPISLMSLAGASFNALNPESKYFVVTGIFKSGYYDFDTSMAFISLDDAETLSTARNPEIYGIKLANRYRDRQMTARLEKELAAFGPTITSWRQYNHSFFSALRIEKLTMELLLGLIFVVVGFNIYHSLRRSVYERREAIAVLKSLGATGADLRGIFLLDGFLIGFVGATIGTLLGLLIAVNINAVFSILQQLAAWVLDVARAVGIGRNESGGPFSLSFFYMSGVPVRLLFHEVLGIFLFATFSSLVAAYGASKRISEIQPAQIMRYE